MLERELNKYKKILELHGKSYGSFNHAKYHYEFLEGVLNDSNIKIVADLGCGTGEFVEWLRDKYKDKYFFGIDPVFAPMDKDYYLIGDSTNIPLKNVDLLTSFDVMEHICYEDLEKSLQEISRVTDFYICNIATFKEGIKVLPDEDLHVIVQELDWWAEKLSKYFKDIKFIDGLVVCRK